MDLEILVLGDGAFVHAVLNGVSMVDGYGTLGAIGALLGLLLLGVKGVMNPGGPKFDPSQLLISFVIFWVMFVPRVDKVIVTEVMVQPGNMAPRSRVVDNVPFGLAAAGYLISNIGVKLTGLYETVLGRPEDVARGTTGGLGENLMLLASMRSMINNPHFTDPPAPGQGKEGGFLENYRANMTTYMAKCAIGLMNNGQWSRQTLMNEPNVTGLLNDVTANPLTHVRLKLNGPEDANGSVFKSCREAKVILLDHSQSPKLAEAFDRATKAAGSTVTSKKVMDAFGEYVGEAGLSAQLMVATHMVNAIQAEAQIRGSLNAMEAQAIIMTEEAAARRNVQWAAEESMFIRILRPIVGFFEGLVYALGPIMAFVVGLGPFGWGLVGKYLMLTVWVALWFPMIAISQLYSKIQMENFFERMGSDYSPQELHQISNQAMDTLGAASALVAATPALAMSLLYGGAVSMSYLASRLQASDMIDENKMVPNASQVAPLHQTQGGTTSSHGAGTATVGANDVTYSKLEAVSDAKQLSDTAMKSSSSAWASALQNSVGSGSGFSLSGSTSENTMAGSTLASEFGSSLSSAKAWSNLSNEEIKTLTEAKDQLVVRGGLGGSVLGISAGVEKALAGTDSLSKMQSAVAAYNNGLSSNEGMQTRFNQAAAHDFSASVGTTATSSFTSGELATLSKTSTDMIQASSAASRTTGLAQSSGTAENVTLNQAASKFSGSDIAGYRAQLAGMGISSEAFDSTVDRMARTSTASDDGQKLGAVIDTLKHGSFAYGTEAERASMLSSIQSKIFATAGGPEAFDNTAHTSAMGSGPAFGGAQAAVGDLAAPGMSRDQVQTATAGGMDVAAAQVAAGSAGIAGSDFSGRAEAAGITSPEGMSVEDEARLIDGGREELRQETIDNARSIHANTGVSIAAQGLASLGDGSGGAFGQWSRRTPYHGSTNLEMLESATPMAREMEIARLSGQEAPPSDQWRVLPAHVQANAMALARSDGDIADMRMTAREITPEQFVNRNNVELKAGYGRSGETITQTVNLNALR